MVKNFTKADLKDGMVVETRAGNRYFKLGSRGVGNDGWLNLDSYNMGLTQDRNINYIFDIVAVYTINDNCCYSIASIEKYMNDNQYLTLIWQSDETECLTADEMAAELSKLTGKKYEVKPSHGDMYLEVHSYCMSRDCPGCKIHNCCHGDGWTSNPSNCEKAYNILKENGEI